MLERHALGMPQALCLLLRNREVRSRRVDVRRFAKTVVEQYVMDGTDATPNVEDGRRTA
jgi:hypothetical protein